MNEIRYHSANRPATVWTRLADWSLVLAFVAAVPLAVAANAMFARTEQAWGVVGTLQRDIEGDLTAYVADLEAPINDRTIAPGERWATFMIEVDQMIRGLPLETSTVIRQPVIDLREYGTARKMTEVDTDAGSPVRIAFVEALERSELEDAEQIVALWQHDGPRTDHNWLAWIASTLLWCVIAFVALSLLLFVGRIGTLVFYRGRNRRIEAMERAGKCPNCGYDLRGLEFSERCPECGELQH